MLGFILTPLKALLCKTIFYKTIIRIIHSDYTVEKLKYFINLIDHKMNLFFDYNTDKEYAKLLEQLEEQIFKYIELSHLLNKPVSESIILLFKDSIETFNLLESLSVKSNLQSFIKMKANSQFAFVEQYNSIVFDEGTNKSCDNCRCIVF